MCRPLTSALSLRTPRLSASPRNFTPPANKLIGLYAEGGAKKISNVFIAGTQHGICLVNPFDVFLRDYFAEAIYGDALKIGQGNAFTAENIEVIHSGGGLVLEGAGAKGNFYQYRNQSLRTWL
jgi:hypothetical protein